MCTSFAVYSQEKAIYGMNFDADDIDLKLKVNSYNDMNLFYFSGLLDNKYRDIAGFNSEDLFICTQAVEYSPSNTLIYQSTQIRKMGCIVTVP